MLWMKTHWPAPNKHTVDPVKRRLGLLSPHLVHLRRKRAVKLHSNQDTEFDSKHAKMRALKAKRKSKKKKKKTKKKTKKKKKKTKKKNKQKRA